MIFKGIHMRRVPSLTYRLVNDTDRYADGSLMKKSVIDGAYKIPVRIKDCQRMGKSFDLDVAKAAFPIRYHSRTDLVVLPLKHVQHEYMIVTTEGNAAREHILFRYYAVIDGKVYTGYQRRDVTPKRLEIIKQQKGKAAQQESNLPLNRLRLANEVVQRL